MKQSNFFNFNSLLKTKYQIKKKNEKGDFFDFRNVKWSRYEKMKNSIVQYKNTLKAEDEFHELNMTRRKITTDKIPEAYSGIRLHT